MSATAVAEQRDSVLVDRFGRRHNNLRISVTDRCNIRCTYCMPESAEFLPRSMVLSFEEIARFARIMAGLGVDKVRLTGGEPLVRADLPRLVALLKTIDGIAEIGLTTNGVLLAEQAADLKRAGIDRLNISLDSLDREDFRRITRRDALPAVLHGIEAAAAVGFDHIKINALAIHGFTERQIVPLARFCRERGFELRFIEFMPLEADGIWNRDRVLTGDRILEILAESGLEAAPASRTDPHAPADEFRYADGIGKLGIVASVSKPFCGSCNRIRLTADGKFRNCLFSLDELDVKTPLRNGAEDEEIAGLLRQCVADKWAGHLINDIGFLRPERTMHRIGG